MSKKKDSDVSILIPTFNRAEYIKRAIDSAISQTYPCEVVVCDHGSNDKTQDICFDYGDKIKYIRREEDHGIHFCELESILVAKGKYIHFCFDDDWMHPEFISICMQLMNKHVGIVYSNHQLVNLKKYTKDDLIWHDNIPIKFKVFSSFLKIPHVMTSLISPSAALVRKEDALSCIYMTTNLVSRSFYNGVGPDWLITAMPLFRYRKCAFISTPLVKFGDHASSITIDALQSNNKDKINKFRAAYNGARLYLIVSTVIRMLYIEEIYFQLEKLIRKVKSQIEKFF